MFKDLFRFFAKRHLLANLFLFLVLVLGAFSLTQMKRDTYPKVEFGELVVSTIYPGASPEDVEINVTNKVEEELKGVTGIKRMTSVSLENSSTIHIVIEPDENIDDVVEDIKDAVDRVTELPEEVEDAPLVTEISTAIFPVIEVGLSGSDAVSYRDLRETAKQFEKRIKEISGVSKVEKFGYRDREVQVEVSQKVLKEYQLPIGDIVNAIRARNIRSTAGTFESYTSEKNVVTLAQFKDPLDVGDVIVRSTFDGPQIKISDLAQVRDGFEEENIISRIDGKNAISMIVYKSENADIIRLVDEVQAAANEMQAFLPEGIEILYTNDISRYVRNRLQVVGSNAILGLTFVMALLGLFFNLTTAFWVAVGIPATIMGVFFLMPFFDAFIEVVSLAALVIVIGIIVDDAIIIAENIARRRELGDTPLDAAVNGLHGVFKPVFTTILTTFLAFAPMFFMTGTMGKFVFVIPLVISLALFFSLFEVVISLPAHLVPGLRKIQPGQSAQRGTKRFDRVRERFGAILFRALRFRYALVLGFILVLTFALFLLSKMDFELFPKEASDTFMVTVEMPVGSSLAATSDKMREVEQLISQLPESELDSFVSRIGYSGQNDLMGSRRENTAMVLASLTPSSMRNRNAEEIVNDLRERATVLTGFEQVKWEVVAGGPPVGKPIDIRVIGADDATRDALAAEVANYLRSYAGVVDVDRDDKAGKDQVELRFDFAELGRLGLTVADIAQNVRIYYDGEKVTSTRYGDEDVDFRVILEEPSRSTVDNLKNLLIPNRQGRLIRLDQVADFVVGPGILAYRHYDGERAIAVTADVVKGEATVLDATKAVMSHFNLTRDWPSMRLVVVGEAQESQESMVGLLKTFAIAAFAIYMLLILLFNSFYQPFVVLFAIPFGLSGVIFAFAMHGEPMGFMALMGVVGMSGVVVNDSLVLVNHYNDLVQKNPDTPKLDLVARASSDRLRAIIITSLTTVVGLLPLAYGIGGSDPFMAPMALALGYGILFATPLTLVLLPSMLLVGEDLRRLFNQVGCFIRRES